MHGDGDEFVAEFVEVEGEGFAVDEECRVGFVAEEFDVVVGEVFVFYYRKKH